MTIDINKVLLALQEFYIEKENGSNPSMDYNYGYMDAMGVLFNMVKKSA